MLKLGAGPPRRTDKGKMILPKLGVGPPRHTDKATMLLLKLGAGPPGHTERGKTQVRIDSPHSFL